MSLRPFLLILLPAAMAGFPAYAANETDESPVIILGETTDEVSRQTDEVKREMDILPLPDGGAISAIRTLTSAEPHYSFVIEDTSLIGLLATLAKTLQLDLNDPRQAENIQGLVVLDDSARDRIVSMSVEEATLAETMDQAAIASGCNIYNEGMNIIIDRCN